MDSQFRPTWGWHHIISHFLHLPFYFILIYLILRILMRPIRSPQVIELLALVLDQIFKVWFQDDSVWLGKLVEKQILRLFPRIAEPKALGRGLSHFVPREFWYALQLERFWFKILFLQHLWPGESPAARPQTQTPEFQQTFWRKMQCAGWEWAWESWMCMFYKVLQFQTFLMSCHWLLGAGPAHVLRLQNIDIKSVNLPTLMGLSHPELSYNKDMHKGGIRFRLGR